MQSPAPGKEAPLAAVLAGDYQAGELVGLEGGELDVSLQCAPRSTTASGAIVTGVQPVD